MNSVFVGDVSDSATAAQLEKLFAIENIQVISIHYTAGSGYALVDCPDQNAADHAIEVLNGESKTKFTSK